MKSADDRRLSMAAALVQAMASSPTVTSEIFGDRGGLGKIFEIKFEVFLEVSEGFRFGGTEAGNVLIEALGHVVRIFPVKSVVILPISSNSSWEIFLARRNSIFQRN